MLGEDSLIGNVIRKIIIGIFMIILLSVALLYFKLIDVKTVISILTMLGHYFIEFEKIVGISIINMIAKILEIIPMK